jgi:hypothetical protein
MIHTDWWPPEPIWMLRRKEKSLHHARNWTPAVQPIPSAIPTKVSRVHHALLKLNIYDPTPTLLHMFIAWSFKSEITLVLSKNAFGSHCIKLFALLRIEQQLILPIKSEAFLSFMCYKGLEIGLIPWRTNGLGRK